jgi:hypothetical protein
MRMGDVFQKIVRFFKAVSVPTARGIDRPLHQMFMTRESLFTHMPIYFGH